MPTRKVQIIDDDGTTILSERTEPLDVAEGQFVEAINKERAMKAVEILENGFDNWGGLTADERARAIRVVLAALAAVIRNQMHMLNKSAPNPDNT